MFDGKVYLNAGRSSSFGHAVFRWLINDFREFHIFSRDEKTQNDIRNAKWRFVVESERIFTALHVVFDRPDATKADVVAALGDYLPNFHHAEKDKGLDSRM